MRSRKQILQKMKLVYDEIKEKTREQEKKQEKKQNYEAPRR